MSVYLVTRRLSWFRQVSTLNSPGVVDCLLFTTPVVDSAITPTGTQAFRFDENGANPVSGIFQTDDNGQVVMFLQPGDYWIAGLFAGIWRVKRFEVGGPVSGRWAGAAPTFATLPTAQADGAPLEVGDVSSLQVTDGSNLAGDYEWDGTTWVLANADNVPSGRWAGASATFAALPTVHANGDALVDGDVSALTTVDGANPAGQYRWDGTSWILAKPDRVPSGRWAGSSATFAGLPTAQVNGDALVVGDHADLTADDGANGAGRYRWNGTAWALDAPAAMLTDPGNWTGASATFAGLPTTQLDGDALEDGDISSLTADDGANPAGTYRWTGTNWVLAAPDRGPGSGRWVGDSTTFVALPTAHADATDLQVGDIANLTETDGASPRGRYRWNGTAWALSENQEWAAVHRARWNFDGLWRQSAWLKTGAGIDPAGTGTNAENDDHDIRLAFRTDGTHLNGNADASRCIAQTAVALDADFGNGTDIEAFGQLRIEGWVHVPEGQTTIDLEIINAARGTFELLAGPSPDNLTSIVGPGGVGSVPTPITPTNAVVTQTADYDSLPGDGWILYVVMLMSNDNGDVGGRVQEVGVGQIPFMRVSCDYPAQAQTVTVENATYALDTAAGESFAGIPLNSEPAYPRIDDEAAASAGTGTAGSGREAGSAATFAALPTTHADGSAITTGDFALLTADDGGNVAGTYRYDGTNYVVYQASGAAAPQSGRFIGTATTVAGFPTTHADGTALSTGDTARLTAIDGTNVPGEFQWDGTNWVALEPLQGTFWSL